MPQHAISMRRPPGRRSGPVQSAYPSCRISKRAVAGAIRIGLSRWPRRRIRYSSPANSCSRPRSSLSFNTSACRNRSISRSCSDRFLLCWRARWSNRKSKRNGFSCAHATHHDLSPPYSTARAAIGALSNGSSRESVQHIGPSAASFRSAVDAAIAQHDPLCIQSVTQAFVASYRTFSESLEAARAHRSMDASTADVLTRILNQLKNEYAEGLTGMRADIARLQACDASLFKAFCSTANDKIDRLEQFWKTAYPHLSAPKADGMESGI